MPKKQHSEEQIIAALKQYENGDKTANICRKPGISQATALADRTPASFASSYAITVERFAPIDGNTASSGARQGFARRQRTPPLTRLLACQKISTIGAKLFSKSLILEIRY